jgi:hypothetical protein
VDAEIDLKLPLHVKYASATAVRATRARFIANKIIAKMFREGQNFLN